MSPLIKRHRQALLALAQQYGVVDVRVFGSMARGDDGPMSDVDLLVTPLPGTSALDLGGLLMDAQSLLNRRVDLVSDRSLSPLIRQRVLAEAQPL
jgi:predicted nucleotidyltransferase